MTHIIVNTDTNTLVGIVPGQSRAELRVEALRLEIWGNAVQRMRGRGVHIPFPRNLLGS